MVDYCTNNPCKNGGTCINLDDKFECICSEAAKGLRCEGKRMLELLIQLNRKIFLHLIVIRRISRPHKKLTDRTAGKAQYNQTTVEG